MVVVQNRCQKWKEHDEISKNVNFEATDGKLRDLERFESLKNVKELSAGGKVCHPAAVFHINLS